MRKFKCRPFHDIEVDLDDPETYKDYPQDWSILDDMMFQKIGYAITYMDYLRPEVFPKRKKLFQNPYTGETQVDCSYLQRQRVYKLINEFAQQRRHHYGNVLWLQEKIFLFEDEIENMC